MATEKTYEQLCKEFEDNMREYIHTGSERFLMNAVKAMAAKVDILEKRIEDLTDINKPIPLTVNVSNTMPGTPNKKSKDKSAPIEQYTE